MACFLGANEHSRVELRHSESMMTACVTSCAANSSSGFLRVLYASDSALAYVTSRSSRE